MDRQTVRQGGFYIPPILCVSNIIAKPQLEDGFFLTSQV